MATGNNEGAATRPSNGGGSTAVEPDETTPLIGTQNADNGGNIDEEPDFNEQARKQRRQRWITVGFLLLLFIALIVLIIVFGVLRRSKMNATSICLTPACVHVANEFLQNLSPNYQHVDACTKFDEFVCDGWRSHHDIRPDQGYTGTFNIIADDNQMVLRHIVEGAYPGGSDHSTFSPRNLAATSVSVDEENFDELQRAYNACMAVGNIQKVGLTPLQKILSDIEDAFPVADDTYGKGQVLGDQTGALADAIVYFARLGLDSVLSFGVGPDDKDPDVVVISTGPRYRIGLPTPDYYLDGQTRSDYTDMLSKVLGAIHPNKKVRASTDKLASAVTSFEASLAELAPPLEDLQDITKAYNPMSLDDTVKLIPQAGLDEVFKSLAPSNYTVDRLLTSFPDTISSISRVLSNTSIDTVQTFLYWKAIQALSGYLEAPELKPLQQFSNVIQGKDPNATPERYRTCLDYVDSDLGWLLSRFFIEASFSANAKDVGNQIIADIREQFIARIQKLDWMDDKTKDVAIQKAQNIIQKIGYPTKSPNVEDPEDLSKYYQGVNITDVFFDNVIEVAEFNVKQTWSELGKPTDRNRWEMTAETVNAYYNPPMNEIVFPAGIMQFPVFGDDLPSYVNYGAFGAVAGHELSHAFDNNGRNYDSSGKYTDWWTNTTVSEFKTRADCFVKEYSNFTVQGQNGSVLHVIGSQTLGENIADAGGLSVSYNAWQARRQNSPDQDLPGLSAFTQEQLFYIAYGNFWCSKYTPQALTQRIYADVHSPNMWRIQGAAMMNSRGFKQAFNCPAKEPVCELW